MWWNGAIDEKSHEVMSHYAFVDSYCRFKQQRMRAKCVLQGRETYKKAIGHRHLPKTTAGNE